MENLIDPLQRSQLSGKVMSGSGSVLVWEITCRAIASVILNVSLIIYM